MQNTIFKRIDAATDAASRDIGNFLLFVGKCLEIEKESEISKFTMYRKHILEEGAEGKIDESELTKELQIFDNLKQLWSDYLTDWTDISDFDSCKSFKEFDEILEGTKAGDASTSETDGTDMFEAGWKTKSGLIRKSPVATHRSIFYDEEGKLTLSKEIGIAQVSCEEIKDMQFMFVNFDEITATLADKETPNWLRLKLCKVILFYQNASPALIGFLPDDLALNKLKFVIGGTKVTALLKQCDTSLKNYAKQSQEDLDNAITVLKRISDLTLWTVQKKLTDPITGLKYNFILV